MKKYYNTIEELKYAYENSDMDKEELREIINNGKLSNTDNVYYKLKGDMSFDKAEILIEIWKKTYDYEIY